MNRSSVPSVLWCCLAAAIWACSDAPSAPSPLESAPLPRASFELWGRILGPVSSDDDSDIEISLKESGGVSAELNFVRLTCNNRSTQEWGARSFVSELGTNRIEARATLVIRRHYTCRSSGRPQHLLADLTDANGHHHRVEAVPYHPDWPGVSRQSSGASWNAKLLSGIGAVDDPAASSYAGPVRQGRSED